MSTSHFSVTSDTSLYVLRWPPTVNGKRPGLIVQFFLAAALLWAAIAKADVLVEQLGQVETLPEPFGNPWFWASDPILERVSLVDFRSNLVLGGIDAGWGITVPLFPRSNTREFYVPETHYSRGSRGERTDLVTVYETRTLNPIAEVIIPAKRAHNALPIANAILMDDEQFLAVFNMNPAQSISIVDVKNRRFVEEIPTPGCSLVYAAGERRIMMICGNGSLLFISLNSDGSLLAQHRTEAFFDPQKDPLTEKGVRVGQYWYFVSFEGYLYSINVDPGLENSSEMFSKPWSLINEDERKEKWRIGGRQFLAIHDASNVAYILMHQGDIDTHKTGGTHLWKFDLATNQKVSEHQLLSPGFTFSGVPTEFGTDWPWPFNKVYNVLTSLSLEEPHARPDAIVVTQGKSPTLILGGQFGGMVAIYDATDMAFKYRVTTGNYSNLALLLPQWGQ